MNSYLVFGLAMAFTICECAPSGDLEPKLPCERQDLYCKGTTFPDRLTVKNSNRVINCNVVPDPKQQCCLPQAKHMVCYDIKVDGVLLNFGSANSLDTTDFHSLCRAMLESQNKTPGKVSTIYKEEGGGGIKFKYGSMDIVSEIGTSHLKHLACSVEE